jgi:cytochrome c oxidase assembly protein subunit 15
MLQNLGFSNKASEIKNDKSILVEEEFNAVKTWIEYINRLIGALIGIFVILTLYRSLPLWQFDKTIPVLAGINLILVLFQGWIGSIVVSTNLMEWMITLHMILALLIVCLLLYIYYRSTKLAYKTKVTTEKPGRLFLILGIAFILMLVQIVLGTQVREEIDKVAFEFGNMMRGRWIENLGMRFLVHRSYSLVLLAIHLLFIYKIYKYSLRNTLIFKWSQILLLIILFEIISGVGMAYFGIPAFLQPIHLLLGSLIIGIQFLILMHLNDQKSLITENIGS